MVIACRTSEEKLHIIALAIIRSYFQRNMPTYIYNIYNMNEFNLGFIMLLDLINTHDKILEIFDKKFEVTHFAKENDFALGLYYDGLRILMLVGFNKELLIFASEEFERLINE